MADELTKVTRGQPFAMRASTFNAFVDAARAHRGRANDTAAGRRTRDTKSGLAFVRNDSGADLDQFAVLGLEDIVIQPADNEPEFRSRVVFSGITPDETKHRGRFAVLAQPLKADEVGLGYVDDVTPVKINVEDEEKVCDFVEMVDGESGHVESATYGSAALLWREGGTGIQWAVIKIGKKPLFFPVRLEQISGTQGTTDEPATWAYDVYDICSEKLMAEAVDPTIEPHHWRRPTVGWMIAADFGYAQFDDEGELILGWINEQVDQEPCPETEPPDESDPTPDPEPPPDPDPPPEDPPTDPEPDPGDPGGNPPIDPPPEDPPEEP